MRLCARCSVVLTRVRQTRYCSAVCYLADIARPVRSCLTCGTPFKAKGIGQGQRQKYCQAACWSMRVMLTALWVLRANTHTYLTLSDLAIWLYGDDRLSDRNGAKELIHRLRRQGYVFETRSVIPDYPGSWQRVYRLVSEPSGAERSRTA